MKGEKYCAQLLEELARTTKTELGPMMFRIYMREFERIGWELAANALEACFLDLRRFPTANEILEKAGMKKPEEKDEATALATMMWNRISKGAHKAAVDETRTILGEFGWYVLDKLGGLQKLCETCSEDEKATFIAQTRDAIRGFRPVFNQQIALQGCDVAKLIGGGENGVQAWKEKPGA